MGKHRSLQPTKVPSQRKRYKPNVGRSKIIPFDNQLQDSNSKFSSDITLWMNSKQSFGSQSVSNSHLFTNNGKTFSSSSNIDKKRSSKKGRRNKTIGIFSKCSLGRIACIGPIIGLLLVGMLLTIYLPLFFTRRPTTNSTNIITATASTTTSTTSTTSSTTSSTSTTTSSTTTTTKTTTSTTTTETTTSTTTTKTTTSTTTTETTTSTTTTKTTTSTTTTETTTSTTTSTTTVTTTTTTTSFQWRWNATGTTVGGITLTPGATSDTLNSPAGIIIDSSHTLYIADASNSRVQKWPLGSPNATTVAGQSNGVLSTTLNGLNIPHDVAVDSVGNIYVADTYNHRVVLWTPGAHNGTLYAGTGVAGTANNQLNNPYGLSLDSNSNTLYIADFGNHRIMQYLPNSSTGILVAGGNGGGYGNTQLYNPIGLHFDASSNSIYIANYIAHNIVRWVLGASNWILVAGGTGGILGSSSLLLYNPTDVTLDSMNNVYVADKNNQRVQFFLAGEMNGTTIAGVTSLTGSTADKFISPDSVAVDSQFNLYVSDTSNHRIQQFIFY